MNRFFITGIKGFIGVNLANFIADKGFEVKGIDNLSNPSNQILDERVIFKKADILKSEEYISLMSDSDYVIHLAAMSRPGPSIGKDLFCLEQNVYGTQKILESSIRANIKRIIYAGTSSYYGSSEIPHKVNSEGDFLNTYSFTKYLGEEVIRKLSKNKIEFNIFRLFNVFWSWATNNGSLCIINWNFFKSI